MIVPRFWAEGRLQHRGRKEQVTVRRFGWSDVSQADAQANADQRTRDAFRRRLGGEQLPGRDPKVPYNGADGVPIREEIVAEHGAVVITRNAYGARCLNVADVLFADVDFQPSPTREEVLTPAVMLLVSVAAACWLRWAGIHPFAWIAGAWAFMAACMLVGISRRVVRARRTGEQEATRRLHGFVDAHPGWNLRVYRTPAGLRALATHGLFRPGGEDVEAFFETIRADKTFARMCRRQQCFRARVSPKPWRIGVPDHLKPRPGTWPVKPERLPARAAWVERYEAAARGFAACAFVGSVGSGVIDPAVRACLELHDELCGATTGRPLA